MDDETNTGAFERDRELKKELGVSPALAGAAAYEGIPMVTRHLLHDVPIGLSGLLASGGELAAEPGTPLKQIAEFTRAEVKAMQNFARESGVKVPIVAGLEPSLRKAKVGYFMDPDLPSLKLRRLIDRLIGGAPEALHGSHVGLARASVPHALHEIGHAAPILGSHKARQIVQDVGSLMGRGLPGTLSRYALVGNVLAPPDEDASGARQFAYEHAPALVGATFLPELAEEMRASGRAIAGARRHGVGTLKAIKELAPAFGTYAAAAAAPVLATLIAKNLVKALHERGEEKQAAARAGAEVKAPGALRRSATAAWHIGGRTPPKPKTIKPDSRLDATARGRSQANPPSNRAYYKDLLESLYNPQRGFRLATVG
jgi:hypothetical protein